MRTPPVTAVGDDDDEDAGHPSTILSSTNYPYYDPAVRNQIALWDGDDVSELDVDVIVRFTDSSLTSSDEVFRAIGHHLKEYLLTHDYDRKAGSVVVTPGWSLRCRQVVHATRATHATYAHGGQALHLNFRGALNKAIELGARSVAIVGLEEVSRHSSQRDEALRILMCSIRSELERRPHVSVVLSTPLDISPTFPSACACAHRYPNPERDSKLDIRLDDKRIRIIHNPQSNFDSADDEASLYDDERVSAAEAAAAALACSLDTQPLLAPGPRPSLDRDDDHHLHEYERLLRRAQTEDLTSISGIGCLYQSGVDRLGRPVVIFIGKWFPFSEIDLEKAMLYLIQLLDPIVRGDYVIAYFHTLASAGNHPPFSWLREVYSVLPYKYKKNLKAFYIVHPTFWTKMMTWWFTTFMAPAIKAKVHSLPGVEYLYSVMARDQLEVPAFVTEYDMTINGLHYFQPDTNNT